MSFDWAIGHQKKKGRSILMRDLAIGKYGICKFHASPKVFSRQLETLVDG
ncbi:hypothetical protein QT972_06860 [Microcoleus sp. herbarium7]